MPRAFETFSNWGNPDARVTSVQEVLTTGCTGVTNALPGNLLSSKWP